jgi:copper chaperone CopZ
MGLHGRSQHLFELLQHTFVAAHKYTFVTENNMKKVVLLVAAVSLRHKALGFAAARSPSPDFRFSTKQNTAEISNSPRASWKLGNAVSPKGSSLRLQGGVGGQGSGNTNDFVSRGSITILASSTSSPSSLSSSQISSSYYLVWSPGFLRKFVLAGASLWGMHMLQLDVRIASIVSRQWRATRLASATQNLVLPLLSSSCCLLQLLINAMVGAGGCAGFNTVLGPVRPFFLALLVGLNALTGASMQQSFWRYVFAMMPEGVHFWNEFAKHRWRNRVMEEETNRHSTNLTGQAVTSKPRLRATMLVDIPTMGCVACINKIDSSLRNCAPNQIVEASSWLQKDKKGGNARLEVFAESEEELQMLSNTVVKTIDDAGFEGSVVTDLQVFPETK